MLKAEEGLAKGERLAVVALVCAMSVLSFAQVLMRIVFHSGIIWLDPVLRHMVLWVGLLGAALAARHSHHFALDAFAKLAPARLHRPLEVFAALFTAFASALLFYASCKFVRDEFASGAVAFHVDRLAVPGGWAEIIIPAAFLLIGVHTLAGIWRPKDPAEEKL